MKKQMAFFALSLLLTTSAFATEISIQPGQSVRVRASDEAVVSCEKSSGSSSSSERPEIARFCRCYAATFNGSMEVKAYLKIMYSQNSSNEIELRSWDYSSDYKEKCERFIRETSSCR